MGKAVGIDLGTTNSVVAVRLGDEVVVITNDAGHRTTPSVVAFKPPDGEVLVGIPAKRQAAINPKNTIFSIKRIMGKTYEEAQPIQSLVGYEIVRGTANLASVNINGKTYTPQEISAMILSKLKKVAEDYLGEPVTEAVITVPAYFNDAQRKATIEAGEIAGLRVLRIINEPTAAALAYGCDKNKSGNIAVFDLGGGTFDISILEIGEGVFEVKATSGDNFLGGDDFDKRIVNHIINEIKKEGIDVSNDPRAMQRIREAAEQAKIELSSQQATEINLPYITVKTSTNEPISVSLTITRAQFESMCSDLFDRLREPCSVALKQSGLRPEQIHEVILVGGSTRIPKVQEIVKTIFGREPSKSVNPDESVAIGAAIQAAVLKGDIKDLLLLDVTPLSLGVAMKDDLFAPIIEANTTIPCKRGELFTTVADGQTEVKIDIYQGDRPIASANKHLGTFTLEGIPPAPRGVPQIEITFDIDANGVLTVSAKDKATGKEKSIRISGASNLPKDEIERMKQEAETYRAQDEQRVEELKKINECDNLTNQIESFVRENGDKLPGDAKNELQDLVNEIKSIKETKDWNRLVQLEQNLYNKLGALYQTLSTQPEQQQYTNGSSGYEHVQSSSETGAAAEPEVKATPVDYVDVE